MHAIFVNAKHQIYEIIEMREIKILKCVIYVLNMLRDELFANKILLLPSVLKWRAFIIQKEGCDEEIKKNVLKVNFLMHMNWMVCPCSKLYFSLYVFLKSLVYFSRKIDVNGDCFYYIILQIHVK